MSRSTILHIILLPFLALALYTMQAGDLPVLGKYCAIFIIMFGAGIIRKSYSPQRDLGLEGLVLTGAAVCSSVFSVTQSIWLSLLAGSLASMTAYCFIQHIGTLLQQKAYQLRVLIVLTVGLAGFSAANLIVQQAGISAVIAAVICGICMISHRLQSCVTKMVAPLLGMALSAAMLLFILQEKFPIQIPGGDPLLLSLNLGPIHADAPVLLVILATLLASVYQVYKQYSTHTTQEKQQPCIQNHCTSLAMVLLHGLLVGFAGAYAAVPSDGLSEITPVGIGLAAMVIIPLTGRILWKLLLMAILLGILWVALAPSMTTALLVPVLAAAVQAGTPILYATLGAIVTERSGVLNLGVEGMMMVGAFAGFACVVLTGSPWISLLVAGLASAFMASIHGTVCLVFRGSQVVSGLALTIFGTGVADYLGKPYIGKIATAFDPFAIPLLSELPGTGKILFSQDALVYLCYLCIPLFWFFLKRTRLGLGLRSAGENPAATLASGLSPQRMRWMGLLIGGFTIGLGGAYLSLAYTHMWTNSITAGRGWIAVALVIFAFWQPVRAMFGAYLFGGIWVFQLRLQAAGTDIPSNLLAMFPYILTLVVLVISSVYGTGRSAPAALGVNLEPGD